MKPLLLLTMVSLLLQAQSDPAAFAGLTVPQYPYDVANYVSGSNSDALRIFPFKGDAITIDLPFRLSWPTFGPDGKSLYGVVNFVVGDQPALSRIEFNPTRVSPVPGTAGFSIRSFAVSSRQDKIVISGHLRDASCGVFEVGLPGGNVKQVLNADCHDRTFWNQLSLSPNGDKAIASVGSNTGHDLHMEMIDLVHGTTKSLGTQFWVATWSPDGKWIVARENRRREKLFLIDAADFSRRRTLGDTVAQWSPDSRYLLLWKEARCGAEPDLEPPGTLEALDVQSEKRSKIPSSSCQVRKGPTGWVSSEIMNGLLVRLAIFGQ